MTATTPDPPLVDDTVRPLLFHLDAAGARAVAWVFAIDARMAQIAASTTEPMLGLMRLTWWREAIARLDAAPAPAEPLLQGLSVAVLPRGVTGAGLAMLVEPWEAMVDPASDADTLRAAHGARGRALFAVASRVAGVTPGDGVMAAGESWALAMAGRSDAAMAELRVAAGASWPRPARPFLLPALARARRGNGVGAIRLLAFLLTGRGVLSRADRSG